MILIDSYAPESKTVDTSRKILAVEASNVATTLDEFEQNYESRRVILLSVDLVACEKDQVANRIPNPKKPGYHAIGASATPEETKLKLYNRLYIAVEPESDKVEITVKHPIIPQPLGDQFSHYSKGTVTLKLNKSGNKIVTEEIKMVAKIEDYYDFDFTRPTESFSNHAAIVQIGHEAGHRPKGEIYHTVTEIDFSYNESNGDLINGGPPVSFFNENGYIEDGLFVTTGGGGGGGDE